MNPNNSQEFVLSLAEMVNTLLPIAAAQPTPLSGPHLIYGAGNKGRQVAEILLQHGYEVWGFADQDPTDKKHDLLPVRSIGEWKQHASASEVTIVVAVHNFRAAVAAILKDLEREGFARLVSPVEFHGLFPDALENHYWLTATADHAQHFSRLPALAEHLVDRTSQILLEAVIRFRLTGNYSCLPRPAPSEQYCPSDIPPWPQPVRLVDCGAFNGDTLRSMLETGIHLESVIAFEPDPGNFAALASYVRNAQDIPPVLCFPAGVGERTKICNFESASGAASKISNLGEDTIQIVALDDVIGSFSPSLLKMDVEGAELQALKGARHLLQKHRPSLAISLYHRPEDLWDIPDFLLSLELGYDFFLRCHGENSFDLVLYAVSSNIR